MARSKDPQTIDTEAALELAREGRRGEFLRLVQDLEPAAAGASADQLWLLGQREYWRGAYPEAIRLFQLFDAHPERHDTPAWQRYASLHRQGFAQLKAGEYDKTRRLLKKAEALIASTKELSACRADVDAMYGHIHEKDGDFQSALARFQRAYAASVDAANWERAATTASDVARILGILQRPAPGLEWLDKARAALKKRPNEMHALVVKLRDGMLQAALGELEIARSIFSSIIDAAESNHPPTAVDALLRRAEVLLVLKRHDAARRDYERALALCSTHGLHATAVYAHKDLATYFLERGESANMARAAREYQTALRLALALEPTQTLMLLQLAEDLLAEPALSGRRILPTDVREALMNSTTKLRQFSGPAVYQRTTRRREWTRGRDELERTLRRIGRPDVLLATCVVKPFTGRVENLHGKEIAVLRGAQLDMLNALLEASGDEVALAALAKQFGTTVAAVQKRLQRLREAIGTGNLRERRQGNDRFYSLAVIAKP